MAFEWKKLLQVAQHLPVVRGVMGATLQELETNPDFVRFVTKYQKMTGGEVQCMVCMAHKFSSERGLNLHPLVPSHECADQNYQRR